MGQKGSFERSGQNSAPRTTVSGTRNYHYGERAAGGVRYTTTPRNRPGVVNLSCSQSTQLKEKSLNSANHEEPMRYFYSPNAAESVSSNSNSNNSSANNNNNNNNAINPKPDTVEPLPAHMDWAVAAQREHAASLSNNSYERPPEGRRWWVQMTEAKMYSYAHWLLTTSNNTSDTNDVNNNNTQFKNGPSHVLSLSESVRRNKNAAPWIVLSPATRQYLQAAARARPGPGSGTYPQNRSTGVALVALKRHIAASDGKNNTNNNNNNSSNSDSELSATAVPVGECYYQALREEWRRPAEGPDISKNSSNSNNNNNNSNNNTRVVLDNNVIQDLIIPQTSAVFRPAVPLSRMIDILMPQWEEEGLYDAVPQSERLI